MAYIVMAFIVMTYIVMAYIYSSLSTSAGYTFSPPVIIRSFTRDRISQNRTVRSAISTDLTTATSPVLNHPSAVNESFFASGRFQYPPNTAAPRICISPAGPRSPQMRRAARLTTRCMPASMPSCATGWPEPTLTTRTLTTSSSNGRPDIASRGTLSDPPRASPAPGLQFSHRCVPKRKMRRPRSEGRTLQLCLLRDEREQNLTRFRHAIVDEKRK